jgi:rfaE bifunctional protein kinase chain/domain
MSFPNLERVEQILGAFAAQKVLVLGDVMLDRYLWGDTSRISPEAPVPVIEALQESVRLGGAANVAHNVRALGGEPLLVGLVGEDGFGHELTGVLQARGIAPEWLVRTDRRRTTCKTRILARNQQVVRVDREDLGAISGDLIERIVESARRSLDLATACVVSDYGKGVILPAVLEPILQRARARGIPVCVDPKETHFQSYRGVTLITPNQSEAGVACGRRISDLPGLLAAGGFLLESLACESVLITRGEHGMALFRQGAEPLGFPVISREVFDVTGAGDTVVSVCALTLAAGADPTEAAAIANHAAGRVIREVGTATTTREALRASFLANDRSGAPAALSADSVDAISGADRAWPGGPGGVP